MKNIKQIIIPVLIGLSLVSCGDDFLEKKPTETISVKDLQYSGKLKPVLAASNLRGIYNQMVMAGSGGTGDDVTNPQHEDFGHKSFDLISDILSSDLALSEGAYARWVNLAKLDWTKDQTKTIPNSTAWTFYFTIIKSANLVIESSGGNDVTPSEDGVKAAMGQAKTLRAFAYFYLSQFYALEYDAAKEILPIYTEVGQPSAGKSTMGEVYDLMIKDLTQGIALMNGFERENKAFINADVAKGLLAYVYASRGNNAMARDLAEEIINAGRFQLMDSAEVTGGFTKLTTPGWMWGFDLTKDNSLGLVSWAGMMDYYSYSYQSIGNSKGIDIGLYDRIGANDIRKKQSGGHPKDANGVKIWTPGASPLIPSRKFYNLELRKMSQNPMEDDYVYMRVAEMYLLSAELSAVLGDEDKAKNRLKELLAKRFDAANIGAENTRIDALTGTALLEEIVFQTKIELLAEGKSYLLMKRRKLTNTRGSNHMNLAGDAIPYNDPRVTFMIPEKEIQNNPLISSQNY